MLATTLIILAIFVSIAIGIWFGRNHVSTVAVKSNTELAARIETQENESRRLTESLTQTQEDSKQQANELRQETERRSSAEERARHIPRLEEAVASAEAKAANKDQEISGLRIQIARLQSELSSLTSEYASMKADANTIGADLSQKLQEILGLRTDLAEARARLDGAHEQLGKTDVLKEQMTHQFQALANDILEAKSKRFAEQNQENLGALLNPLRERIAEFQKKVEDTYSTESKERVTLQGEIQRLAELNNRINTEAANLTNALKGSNKSQGAWGEFVLETVLESSGLREGHEFTRQVSIAGEDGARSQPDVVINLPESRHMVIDSKVSLVAYERFASAETDTEREVALRAHLSSMRSHLKKLSEKNYQSLYGLRSLDFVLMFIPIEPAFMQAVNGDRALYMDAWKQNVILVSPTTLLATLSTIASIWRREYQSQNALEIARHCASLYDKFVGFVEDLEDVGKKLAATQRSYDDAKSKLSSGRGNLLKQVDRVRLLGVKPSKQLPPAMLSTALIDEEDETPGVAQSAS